MIYNHCNGFEYSNQAKPKNKNLIVPLNVDTEFYNPIWGTDYFRQNPSSTLTVQIRSIDDSLGTIYSHKDNKYIARHSLVTSDFVCSQYLEEQGFKIFLDNRRYRAYDLRKLPKFIFHLYAHFACADLIRLFDNQLLQVIRDCIVTPKAKGLGITQERRLRTYTHYGKRPLPYLILPFVIKYNDEDYQLCIEVRDTIGIAGNISYADLGKLTNVNLPYKNLLLKQDLKNMKSTYLNKQEEYDLYALGDLKVTDMCQGFNKLYKNLLAKLDLPEKNCKLTMGGSVAQILKLSLIKYIGDAKKFDILTKHGNPKYILENYKTTRLIMCKVDGGRCFNNRPTDTVIHKETIKDIDTLIKNKSALIDIDIDGAYGTGLLHQHYPFGTPKSFNHSLDTNNKYLTLREFFKKYKRELKPRLWCMRVSTIKQLKYSQDLISSWVIPLDKVSQYFNNSENEDILTTKEGYVKVFENEIIFGVITSDILEWIDNICSQRQRKELYDNLAVINCYWYDATQECTNINEVIEALENDKYLSTSEYEENRLNTIEEKSHKWCSVSLGDLFLKDLIIKRKEYPKGTSENTFYKLIINTVYGVIVSRYFSVGNLVVGNNITAKCRCMAWYLEKGLNAFQTITDGCTFELDNVNYPVEKRKLTANNLVRTYDKQTRETQAVDKPLKINKYITFKKENFIKWDNITDTQFEKIESFCQQTYKKKFREIIKVDEKGLTLPKELFEFIWEVSTELIKNKDIDLQPIYDIGLDVMEHVRNLFPNISILHEITTDLKGNIQKGHFKLDVKAIAQSGCFHGNADYLLKNCHTIEKSTVTQELRATPDIYRMRGYKETQCYRLNERDENEIGYLEQESSDLGFKDNLETLENVLGINVPKLFLDSLLAHSREFPRLDVFIQEKIIKPNDYKQNYQSTYQYTNLEIGYTLPQARLLSELTLGQFLFRTHNQYEVWTSKQNKNRTKQGQGLEANFINPNGTLDYQKGVEEIAKKISNEEIIRLNSESHPKQEKLEKTKNEISNFLERKI